MKKQRFMLSFVATVVALALVPAAGHATAFGIEYWGGFDATIKGQTVRIPAGQLAHEINGSGYHVKWDGANFASAATLCDPSMRFTYGDGSKRVDGDVHWGCSHNGQWKYTMNFDAPRGTACAELWIEDWERMVAKQCHYIHG